MTIAAIAAVAQLPPLDPDTDTGREWLEQELAKGEYQQARPTLLDLIVERVVEWWRSLFSATGDASPMGAVVTVIAAIAVLAIIGFLIYLLVGRPRLASRSALSRERGVFHDDDERSAAELRAAAERAAEAGDFALAVTERFRAIARDLADRTLVALRPGSTAHDVAQRAATPFPDSRTELQLAASDFDDVRYLDRPGTEAAWQRTRDLDERLRHTTPAKLDAFETVAS